MYDTKYMDEQFVDESGSTQKVVPVMLITPKGGQHNELEAA